MEQWRLPTNTTAVAIANQHDSDGGGDCQRTRRRRRVNDVLRDDRSRSVGRFDFKQVCDLGEDREIEHRSEEGEIGQPSKDREMQRRRSQGDRADERTQEMERVERERGNREKSLRVRFIVRIHFSPYPARRRSDDMHLI